MQHWSLKKGEDCTKLPASDTANEVQCGRKYSYLAHSSLI